MSLRTSEASKCFSNLASASDQAPPLPIRNGFGHLEQGTQSLSRPMYTVSMGPTILQCHPFPCCRPPPLLGMPTPPAHCPLTAKPWLPYPHELCCRGLPDKPAVKIPGSLPAPDSPSIRPMDRHRCRCHRWSMCAATFPRRASRLEANTADVSERAAACSRLC